MDEMARARFKKQIEREKRAKRRATDVGEVVGRGEGAAAQLIPIIELCRHCRAW